MRSAPREFHGLANALGADRFAGMRGQVQPRLARLPKDIDKELRRAARLIAPDTEGHHAAVTKPDGPA